MFGVGIFVTVLFTVITPMVARISVWLFIAVRVLEGIGEVRNKLIQLHLITISSTGVINHSCYNLEYFEDKSENDWLVKVFGK